ncbi:metallophosphoesterase family protein [Endothiovibrio diazotrophicus]
MFKTSHIRVAIVSDTHSFVDPRIAETIRGCHRLVHAGDIGDADVFDQLQPIDGEILAVRGNNDTAHLWPPQHHETLLGLPLEAGMELPGGRLVVLHGDRHWGSHDLHGKLRALYPQARIIVYGHSHTQVIDQDDAPWVVNPGAAGKRLTRGGPKCLVLTASAGHWKIDKFHFPPWKSDFCQEESSAS